MTVIKEGNQTSYGVRTELLCKSTTTSKWSSEGFTYTTTTTTKLNKEAEQLRKKYKYIKKGIKDTFTCINECSLMIFKWSLDSLCEYVEH